jgi:hypothetical protein
VFLRCATFFQQAGGDALHRRVKIGVRSAEETEIAKKVIDNLLQQPDPAEPKPGAQLVGDLDG